MINTNTENLDKRVIRTRKLLRQAFFELMQEQSFQQITVQEITDRAMINRATFYAHFTDKYELFDYSLVTSFEEHLEEMMPSAESLTYNNLRMLSLATLTFLTQFIGHCAPTDRENDLPFEKQIQLYLRKIILDWIEQLEPAMLPDQMSTDLIATATASAIFGSVMYYARGNSKLPQDAYIDQLMTLLTNGVCPMVSP